VHPEPDRVSVAGRDTPRSESVIHAARVAPALVTERDSSIVQTVKPVLQFSCEAEGCDWAPWLDGPEGYSWPDIESKIMRAHEGLVP
jgi:hypothetical protein